MENLTLIILGITSNLAQIKLIPALYNLTQQGLLPKETTIIGIARKPQTKTEFQNYFNQTLKDNSKIKFDSSVFKNLAAKLHYVNGNLDDPNFYKALKSTIKTLNKQSTHQNLIFYLATYPYLYKTIFENLKVAHLNHQKKGFTRLMIEKPIGSDAKSAKELNKLLLKYFIEEQIYRLDHYLGKETLQNILTFRFGNGIFEPLMNKDYIDHIQVSSLEDFGIGKRAGYFDQMGALKDVGQNHLLQMIAFTTMDAPFEFNNQSITKERIKVLKSLNPHLKSLVLGQYEGYKNEENVNPNSQTDTFFAFKTYLKNERFDGVPIYVRSGKKLAKSVSEISIIFKNPHNRLFKHLESGEFPNILTFRIQPNEGIGLQILSKKPGHEVKLDPTFMSLCYHQIGNSPDPYERLIIDAIKGDPTFFNDSIEVELQWRFIDKLVKNLPKPIFYKDGTNGPKEADTMIEKDGRFWLTPSEIFCTI